MQEIRINRKSREIPKKQLVFFIERWTKTRFHSTSMFFKATGLQSFIDRFEHLTKIDINNTKYQSKFIEKILYYLVPYVSP